LSSDVCPEICKHMLIPNMLNVCCTYVFDLDVGANKIYVCA